jgi:hypothetical protein
MMRRCLIAVLTLTLAAPALAGGYGYRHGYSGHYGYRHHGGGNGDVLLAGLVIGGLLGYFISEDRHYRRDAYYTSYSYRHDPHYYDKYYDEYHSYSYRPRVYREYTRVTPRRRAIVEEDSEFAGENCQMTREYTTAIEIDGEKHDAYGTRCLAADGSWVLGRPKLVPEFN